MQSVELDHQHVLNYAARHIARAPGRSRHALALFPDGDPRGAVCESWRFPIIDTMPPVDGQETNCVTFVFVAAAPDDNRPVEVLGTFAPLYRRIPLDVVRFEGEATPYRAASLPIPTEQLHYYRFAVDGAMIPDPINPQRKPLDNAVEWSRFFTDKCSAPISLERWEMDVLVRLTNHILPFRTADGQRFFADYYANADRAARLGGLSGTYRLDQPVGVVNFIDKLLAREEHHNLIHYKICLEQIVGVLGQRFPGLAPMVVPLQGYVDLYDQLGTGQIDGWDYQRYDNPPYFLQMLRRHTWLGAFGHPRYGGNAAAAGWAYLAETFRDPQNNTCFDWRRALAAPLGQSADYLG
jgi:hypothetical protein